MLTTKLSSALSGATEDDVAVHFYFESLHNSLQSRSEQPERYPAGLSRSPQPLKPTQPLVSV
jgi:hypothetical protein